MNRSDKLEPRKSGKLRNLQKILSPLNVVLDTLRQLSSLKQKGRKNQTTFSKKMLKISPFPRRNKKLVFHHKTKHSNSKPPRLPTSYPNKENLKVKPKRISSKYEAFRNCFLITCLSNVSGAWHTCYKKSKNATAQSGDN